MQLAIAEMEVCAEKAFDWPAIRLPRYIVYNFYLDAYIRAAYAGQTLQVSIGDGNVSMSGVSLGHSERDSFQDLAMRIQIS